MKYSTPKRIAIIGLPGSGKSTLAIELGKRLAIPVFHLDKYVFINSEKKRDFKEFITLQQRAIDEDAWIIEGCSIKTLEMRFARADVVIYLKFSRLHCLWRLIKRLFSRAKDTTDTGCAQFVDWPLVQYMWRFDKEKRERIEELKKQFPQVNFFSLNNSHSVKDYLESVQKGISIKKIDVVPYNSRWPKIFEEEAQKIQDAIGDHCLAVHHVGSTSVPGLSAKPVIDMIAVINTPERSIHTLQKQGYEYRGEYNIPGRFFFNKSEGDPVNLHVYQEDHPEIELNLTFRDYLRDHPEVRKEYAELKENLLKDQRSYVKKSGSFTGYNLGKDPFIRKVLKAAGFNRLRITKCTHHSEWEFLRKRKDIELDHQKDHTYLILYHGVEMIGYAHVTRIPNETEVIRELVIDEPYREWGLEQVDNLSSFL